MNYVILLVGYVDPVDGGWEAMDEATQMAWMAQHEAFDQAVNEREGCRLVAGEALTGGDSATVFRRTGDGVELTDGPFAEATEAIGGLYIVQAPDFDTLTELLQILPPYVIEIRPADLSVG